VLLLNVDMMKQVLGIILNDGVVLVKLTKLKKSLVSSR
jgi:hypothetical protein